MDSLVSTQWLADHLGEPDLVIVDSSWHMPATGRNGREEYLAKHIPGARYLDIDEIADRDSPLPHMLPNAADFAAAMRALGIGNGDRIVVYDNSPLRTAARGWFMLRHFGAPKVAILDGGLQKWTAEGREVDSDIPHARSAAFYLDDHRSDTVTKQDLLAGVPDPVLDARGKARFEGDESDPRPGVEAGHIPGARNLPYAALYRDDGTFRSIEELRQLFAGSGVEPTKSFIASCGSGVTANSLIFAAHLLGNDGVKLYAGSWGEWGADPVTPKVKGPPKPED